MTVMSEIGRPRRCSTAEVEGFLLSSFNLKIKADPSFFCPLTGSLLLSPVRLVNSGASFEAKSLSEYFKRAGHKRCPITDRNLDKEWVVIEPDDELHERIRDWAKRKGLDLDALEVAACKLRRPKGFGKDRMFRTLSDPLILHAAFPSSQSTLVPRIGILPHHIMDYRVIRELPKCGQDLLPKPSSAGRWLEPQRSKSVPRMRC